LKMLEKTQGEARSQMMTTQLGYRQDIALTDYIKQRSFTLSAEIIPPRNGAEQAQLLELIQSLRQAGAEFFSVTKGAGGSLRGGSLPIAQAIKDQLGVPSIAHFTCRDLTPQDAENQLIDHHYFGIRNILALRGDPPEGDPNWKAREGGYNYAYQLIEQISRLNQGHYLLRGSEAVARKQGTEFCIGAAAYPEHPDPQDRIEFFVRKVRAGAQFGITQMIYDPEAYGEFLEGLAKRQVSIPILPGTRVLKSQAHAQRVAARFGCKVPSWLLKALPEEEAPGGSTQEGVLEVFEELVTRLKRVGAPGLHLYLIADPVGSSAALQRLASLKKECNH
jgi:methylenetetrahydrofolate reductase (NADPH)